MPSQYVTIQAGIDAADNWDTVWVENGPESYFYKRFLSMI